MAPHHHQSSAETAVDYPRSYGSATTQARQSLTPNTRIQVWQWVHHDRGIFDDSYQITPDLLEQLVGEEKARFESDSGADRIANAYFPLLAEIPANSVRRDEYQELPRLPGYEHLLTVADTAAAEPHSLRSQPDN